MVSLKKMQTELLLLEAGSSMQLWLQARPFSFHKVSSYMHGLCCIAPEYATLALAWQSKIFHDTVAAGYHCHMHQCVAVIKSVCDVASLVEGD